MYCAAVETRSLWKFFGVVPVLKGIDLKVALGEFLAILGPNGAGKTTLIRILSGLSRPSSGQIWLEGYNLGEDGAEVRRRLGVVAHQTLLYGDLTAEENLRFYGRMYGLLDLVNRIHEVLEAVGLTHRSWELVRNLSRGMQQRLALARAILHHPSILLLDEPDTGLDTQAAASLGEMIRENDGEKRTIIMTTHNLERGLALADRVALLAAGRFVYEERAESLNKDMLWQAYEHYCGKGHQ